MKLIDEEWNECESEEKIEYDDQKWGNDNRLLKSLGTIVDCHHPREYGEAEEAKNGASYITIFRSRMLQ